MDNYKVLHKLRTSARQKAAPGGLSAIHVSHRGGSWSGPANSLLTYRKAVDSFKTQALEIDLHLTADGHVVLMHDTCVFSLLAICFP